MWTPPGWRIAYCPPRPPRFNAQNVQLEAHRQRLKYPIYIPAAPGKPANEPFRLCRKKYENYAIDEMKRGLTRSELAREMVHNMQGLLSSVLLDLPQEVINDEGVPGQPALGLQQAIPTRLSGLDAVMEKVDTAYRQAMQDEEKEWREKLDLLEREKGTNMQQFKLMFEHVVFMADTVAEVNWSNKYKSQKWFEKAKIEEAQEEMVMSRVDADWNRVNDIINLTTRLFPYLDGKIVNRPKTKAQFPSTVFGPTSTSPQSYYGSSASSSAGPSSDQSYPPSTIGWGDSSSAWSSEPPSSWSSPSPWTGWSTSASSPWTGWSSPSSWTGWTSSTPWSGLVNGAQSFFGWQSNPPPGWSDSPPVARPDHMPAEAPQDDNAVFYDAEEAMPTSPAGAPQDEGIEYVYFDVDTQWCWSDQSGWHWEENDMIFYHQVPVFLQGVSPDAMQTNEQGEIFKGFGKGKGKFGKSKGKGGFGKGPRRRVYKPFSTKGGWKGHPGGHPPKRPNPGLCGICNEPDHWRDQCPKNPNRRPKGSGKKGSVKGGIFGKPIHFLQAVTFLSLLSTRVNVESFPVESLQEDKIFPYELFGDTPSWLFDTAMDQFTLQPSWLPLPPPAPGEFCASAQVKLGAFRAQKGRILVFTATPGGRGIAPTSQQTWQTLYKYQGHALLLDTGASTNVAGSGSVRNYELNFLQKWGERVHTERANASFSGIGGSDASSDTIGHVSGWPGHGLGRIIYTANLLTGACYNIPMLLCCASMRQSNFVLDFMDDCLYVACEGGRLQPRDQRMFIRVPLVWTGHHYLLHIDSEVEVQAERVYLTLDRDDEEQEKFTVEYGHSKVVGAKDWETQERNLSQALGREISIKRTAGDQMARSRASSSSSSVKPTSSSSASSADEEVTNALDTYYARKPPGRRAKPKSSSGSTISSGSLERQRAEREQHRPQGPPPAVSSWHLGHAKWHFWEWGGDGKVTSYLARNGVVCGPVVSWENGWDMDNPQHAQRLFQLLEQHQPDILLTHPGYRDLRSLHRGALAHHHTVDADQRMLESGLETWRRGIEIQHSQGREHLALAAQKAAVWATKAYMQIKGWTKTKDAGQVTDQCAFGLKDPESGRPIRRRMEISGSFRVERSSRQCKGHPRATHQQVTGFLRSGLRRRDFVDSNSPMNFVRALGKDIMHVLQRREVHFQADSRAPFDAPQDPSVRRTSEFRQLIGLTAMEDDDDFDTVGTEVCDGSTSYPIFPSPIFENRVYPQKKPSTCDAKHEKHNT